MEVSGTLTPDTPVSITPDGRLVVQKPLAFDISSVEDDGQQAARASSGSRRALDWSGVEYYTTEELGPSRELTPEGFMICRDVPVARTGQMVYGPGETPIGIGHDGKVTITRTPQEVFAQKSIASLLGKPVTDDHPPVDVTPDNWKEHMRGAVLRAWRGSGNQDHFLLADLIIYDPDLIRDIDIGKREVSCGYNPDYFEVLDARGDAIPGQGEQGNIIYNHLALVERGRCGPRCSIGDHRTVDVRQPEFFTSRRALRLYRLARRYS